MSSKGMFRITVLLVVMVTILSGCAPAATQTVEPTAVPTQPPSPTQAPAPTEPPAPEPIKLTDGMGRDVSVPAPAQRILSIAPSATEILFAIGAGEQVIGREDTADYPPEVLELPSIGSTYEALNTEAIVAMDPDLVMAAMINSPEHVQAIEDLGIPVFVLGNPLVFEDLYLFLEQAGELTGREAEVIDLVADLRTRVDGVTAALSGVEPRRVYYEVDGKDPMSPWTIGSGTFQDVLITMAGGENITADIDFYGQINLEELVARDPDVMIFSQSIWVSTSPESVAERPGWSQITAVADGAVYGIEGNWIDRPGPRLVDAYEALAAFLHPERFE
jgi:iron complex transport system substrate-binding protein